MKSKKSVLFVVLCMLLSVAIGWVVCDRQMIKKESEHSTRTFQPEELQLANIELTVEGLKTGNDPQMMVWNINGYVEDICLKGLKTTEGMQIFYTEVPGEVFSEEKSVTMASEHADKDCVLALNKTVIDLRIDFTGAEGSVYAVQEIVINPAKYLEWGIGVIAFTAFVGAVIGACLFFLIKEGKNFRIYFQALKKYRFLLEDMVVRDIKLKYRRSVIGLLWSILNPLLMMIVITAVFQHLFRFEIKNFSVYYLTGWVVFNFITEATTGAMTSIIGASTLIRKVYIPKYIFPMQKCVFSFVNMLFSLVALFAVMLVLQVKFTWYILLIPIPLILALIFAIGLGMILATVAVFLRDMIHLYGVFTMVWMYLTPIIYPEEILVGVMQTIMKLNPMYYYVDYFRQLTLYGSMPGMETLFIMCGCSAASLLLGIAVFKKKQDRFILFI